MNLFTAQNGSALVLIVDDDKFMRIQLRHAMEQAGYRVVEAGDGEEGLAIYTRLQPDIVLLDAVMPVMDGFTYCTKLQSLPGGTSTPILMITALEDRESVDRAFEASAVDYITKPIHWAVLRQRVRRILQASQAIEELREQTERTTKGEEQLRLALTAAKMGSWEWDIQSDKVAYSATTEATFGLAPDSFDGTFKSFITSVHPKDREAVTQAVQSAVKEETTYEIEFRVVWPDGTVRWVASRGQVNYDQPSIAVGMVGIVMDITERKQVQEELQRQHLRSQLFAEVTLKIRQSLQIDEILQTAVTEVQKLLAADRVLIFQLGPNGFGKVVTEAVNSQWSSVLGQNFRDEYFASEYLQRYSQGRVYTISDLEKAQIPLCLAEFMQQFNVKAKLAVPILVKQKLWGLMIAHQCATPREWSNFEVELLGQLANQIGIALAQAQMLAHETRQRQELARSNQELEQFAYVASHDLQEPLRKIQAFSDRLKTGCNEALTEQGHDYLERMQNAASRMQNLIDDLLLFSRITSKAQPFLSVNLNQVVREVLSDLEVRIEQTGGQVTVEQLPTIDAEPTQMHQLLQNLIGNALKFHRKEDVPVVRVYGIFKHQEHYPAGYSSEDVCQIIVEDNGIGFDEKYLDRIFNFFQRLHGRSEYEGTGMGLAICRRIVERHGGSISAKSAPEQGATFIVTLPVKQLKGDRS